MLPWDGVMMADLGLPCGECVPCEDDGRANRLARFGDNYTTLTIRIAEIPLAMITTAALK
jgi:hypothetical protein